MIRQINRDKIKFDDIQINMKVMNVDGYVGIISKIDDIHNVYVEYSNFDFGIYCLDEDCDERTESDILYKV
jgi:hypothetical protein